MKSFPYQLAIPPDPNSESALISLLNEVCRSASCNSIRLQCVLPHSGTLSSQWSIVSGDTHVVATTTLDCLREAGPHTRAILVVGAYHVSVRVTASGYSATVTQDSETPAPPSTETATQDTGRDPGISSGIPLGEVINPRTSKPPDLSSDEAHQNPASAVRQRTA